MGQVLTDRQDRQTDGIAAGSSLLNGQYVIRSRLGGGGFAMIFIATDSLERQVVIKECFPAEICVRRNGQVLPRSAKLQKQFAILKSHFVREARQMAKLVHPNIVAVHQVFEENNTAYMALDLIRGMDFFDIVERQPERITGEFVRSVLDQCLTAIGFIHDRKLLHRDISPDNIMVDERGHLSLIDFGAARERDATTRASPYMVKDGYSPHEMYRAGAELGYSSDLYSLGATLHFIVTGSAPPDSDQRLLEIENGGSDPYTPLSSGDWSADNDILVTIDRALSLRQAERFQSVGDWRDMLAATPRQRPAQPPVPAFDAAFEKDIAQMVRQTNSLLDGVGQAPRRKSAAEVKAEQAAAAPQPKRKVFDVFGNEIIDIEAWQEQQEAELRERNAKHAVTSPEDDGAKRRLAEKPRSGSKARFLADLFARCVPRQDGLNLKSTDT
ncbi:serine/threonine-protein kinase [Sulfitobacter sp. D35]|uniref:serine/threonine protein kinase n=1 Tax=Sulfitobacter sp. D35 TaxID=3083252 RepID=UPI00296FFBFC|nr:serine/threonine-protein kinase [Sulfitobacter sp. D35]MDW4497160.1 serine/threonine-protein kinase [Sulfitobacter sp. D35]